MEVSLALLGDPALLAVDDVDRLAGPERAQLLAALEAAAGAGVCVLVVADTLAALEPLPIEHVIYTGGTQ